MNTALTRPSSLAQLRLSWWHWMSGTSPVQPRLWVQLAWTISFSLAIALFFTLVGFATSADTLAKWLDPQRWTRTYGANLVVSLTIGIIIQLLYKLAFALVDPRRILALQGWRRSLFFSGLPLLGTLIGWPIGIALVFGNLGQFTRLSAANLLSLVVIVGLISLGFHTYFSLRIRGIRAEMRASEAQLRLLQGQMEPHFLFNTLANVISLIDADAPRARRMLEELTDYLRASLGGLRHADSTLASELDLARRYLQLMQSRMGERLRFEIDADASLGAAALMPLVLQPLIENAVKHGLEPQVEGGTVRIKATRQIVAGRDSLQVCVEDDGAGLAAAAGRPRRRVAGGADGNGVALANLRERLQTRFGAGASLSLDEAAAGHGTRACIVIPWQANGAATA